MERILIDMDDVMADASGGILKLYNGVFGTSYSHSDFYNTSLWENEVAQKYLSIRHKLFEKGFFRNLEVKNGAQQAIRRLQENYEIFIVSAAVEFPNSLKEKVEWLEEFFPNVSWKNIVFCGDKRVAQGDIMIDDHEKNLISFNGRKLLFNAIHNQKLEGYERVNSWEEIEKLLLS